MTQFTDKPNATPAQDSETTVAYMRAQLGALVAAMAAKGIDSPIAKFTLTADNVCEHIMLSSYSEHRLFNGSNIKFCSGNTFAKCIVVAEKAIADLPDPSAAVMREYQRKVAAAIDYGALNSIKGDFVAPLRNVSQTISEGLLANQRDRKGDEA